MIKRTSAAVALLACQACMAAPVTYNIDSSHTYPSFETDHTGLSLWRGKVNKTTGKVVLDVAAKTGTVDIVMDMSTIDFGHDGMNKHALGEDILNVAEYPHATYKGTIRFSGDKPEQIDGDLTLRGVTRPVTVFIKTFGCAPSPITKKETCGADAYASFNRDDFGVAIGKEHGSRMQTKLFISIEARKAE
jgi:polyisoprenoid-binding protein YceI